MGSGVQCAPLPCHIQPLRHSSRRSAGRGDANTGHRRGRADRQRGRGAVGGRHDVIGLDLLRGPQVSIVGDCYRRGGVASAGRDDRCDRPRRSTPCTACRPAQRRGLPPNQCRCDVTAARLCGGGGREPFRPDQHHLALWSCAGRRMGRPSGSTSSCSRSRATSTTRPSWRRKSWSRRRAETMTVTSLRMSRCFPEPAEFMAWYRLHRGIDRRDVAEAHALALDRRGPPATYVISAATPFEPRRLRSS